MTSEEDLKTMFLMSTCNLLSELIAASCFPILTVIASSLLIVSVPLLYTVIYH